MGVLMLLSTFIKPATAYVHVDLPPSARQYEPL